MSYKYSTEEAIICYLKNHQLTQIDEFDKVNFKEFFDENNPANIYFILSKRRIAINPNYIDFSDTHVELEFDIQDKNKIEKQRLRIEHYYPGLKEMKIISNYPYNYFEVKDEENTTLYGGKTAYFLDVHYNKLKQSDLIDYEILYIGQSLDIHTSVPVIKRIKKHETFIKILADYNLKHPDKEVFLLFASFVQNNTLEMLGSIPLSTEDEVVDIEKFKRLASNPSKFTKKGRITLIEGGLINYFKPEYNEKFKHNFPSEDHIGYQECYNADINTFILNLDVVAFRNRIYTSINDRKNYYEIKYNFQNSFDRRKMFE